ncbi:unnamed protein product, partial [Tilletia controversa]
HQLTLSFVVTVIALFTTIYIALLMFILQALLV